MSAEYSLKYRFRFGDKSGLLPLENCEDRDTRCCSILLVESLIGSNVWISELFYTGHRKLLVGAVYACFVSQSKPRDRQGRGYGADGNLGWHE